MRHLRYLLEGGGNFWSKYHWYSAYKMVALTWDQMLIRGNTVSQSSGTRTNSEAENFLRLMKIQKKSAWYYNVLYRNNIYDSMCYLYQ